MKKIILSSISLILVAAITLVALAATTGLTNDKIEKMKETKYDDGSAFKISNNAAPKYTNAEGLNAVDGDTETVWSTTKKGSYTQLTFKEPTSINNVHITEVRSATNVSAYHLEAWNGKEWVKIYYNDIIEGYYCAAIDPIKTLAIRLYIDNVKNASAPAQIAELSATYQRPIEFDREFINATYAVPNWIVNQEYDQNQTNPEYLDNLTDLYVNADFGYDKNGDFVINRPVRGDNKTVDIIYPWKAEDKQQTYDFMIGGMDKLPDIEYGSGQVSKVPAGTLGVLPFIESKYGEKSNPKLWITMGTLGPNSAVGDVGGINARDFNAFRDPAKRARFIEQVTDFLVEYEIEGMDIDWEYPGTTQDWRAFGSLIKELSASLHAVGKELASAQFSQYGCYGLTADEINSLDRINMMSYDQRGTSPMGHHASYYGATVEDIQRYINSGCDPKKLVLGTAWYSTDFNKGWDGIAPLFISANIPTIEIKGMNFANGVGKTDGINGPNLVADRVLYAIKRKIGGVFSFQSICDYHEYGELSLGKAQDDILANYLTYSEGTKLTDPNAKSTKYTDLLKSGEKDPSKK